MIVATEAGQTARFTPIIRELVPFAAMRVLVPLPEPVARSARRDVVYDGVMTVETWSPSITASGPVLGSARDFVERFRSLHGYDPDARARGGGSGRSRAPACRRTGRLGRARRPSARRSAPSTSRRSGGAWPGTRPGATGWPVSPVLQQQGDAIVTVYPRELASGHRYPLAGWPRLTRSRPPGRPSLPRGRLLQLPGRAQLALDRQAPAVLAHRRRLQAIRIQADERSAELARRLVARRRAARSRSPSSRPAPCRSRTASDRAPAPPAAGRERSVRIGVPNRSAGSLGPASA